MNKPAVTLDIDSSRQGEILVAIEKEGERFEKKLSSKTANAQNVLPLVEALMHEHGLTIQSIQEIRVHTGPGSFTGLRVGVAVGNILGMLLAIPINGQPPGRPILPDYPESKW